jgi:hypothetical protein
MVLKWDAGNTNQSVTDAAESRDVVVDVDSEGRGILQILGHAHVYRDDFEDISAPVEDSMLVREDWVLRIARNVKLAEDLVDWEEINGGHDVSQPNDRHAQTALHSLWLDIDLLHRELYFVKSLSTFDLRSRGMMSYPTRSLPSSTSLASKIMLYHYGSEWHRTVYPLPSTGLTTSVSRFSRLIHTRPSKSFFASKAPLSWS